MASYKVLAKDGVRYLGSGRFWRKGASFNGNQLPQGMVEKMLAQGLIEEIDHTPPVFVDEIMNIDGVTQTVANSLHAAGYDTVDDLVMATVSQLTNVRGIGIATANRISKAARAAYDAVTEED